MGRILLSIAIILLFTVALVEEDLREKHTAQIQKLKKENQALKGTPVIRSATPQKETPCPKETVRHSLKKRKVTPVVAKRGMGQPMPAQKQIAPVQSSMYETRQEYAINLPATADSMPAAGSQPDGNAVSHSDDDVLSGTAILYSSNAGTGPRQPGNGDAGHDHDKDKEHDHDKDGKHDRDDHADNDKDDRHHHEDMDRDREHHEREDSREHGEGYEHEEHGDDHERHDRHS